MLTSEDIQRLSAPFALNEHEFKDRFVYITEEAITSRLDDVDPTWSFDIVSVSIRDNQCMVHARLTVGDVTRAGIGMQEVVTQGAAPREAEKGAATDALKRCARLFGAGRYLLNAPSRDAFPRWLEQLQLEVMRNTPRPAPQAEQKPAQPKAANGAQSAQDSEGAIKGMLWGKYGKGFEARQHFDHWYAKHAAGLTLEQADLKMLALKVMPDKLAKVDIKADAAMLATLEGATSPHDLKVRVLSLTEPPDAAALKQVAETMGITIDDSIIAAVLLPAGDVPF